MRAKEYPLLQEAVEVGLNYGIHRLFKYGDVEALDEAMLKERQHVLEDAVVAAICERFALEGSIDE